tara:strand:+ start:505 stop:744 length:240 start_codon:yes stop_codon:yes gene_type:complete
MKKIYLVGILLIFTSLKLSAEVDCKKLPGFKKIGKDSLEYTKCIAKKGAKKSKEIGEKGLKKLNTDSKLTDWIKKKLDK